MSSGEGAAGRLSVGPRRPDSTNPVVTTTRASTDAAARHDPPAAHGLLLLGQARRLIWGPGYLAGRPGAWLGVVSNT